MKLRTAIVIASIVSFVSISMEILWVSVIGYVMKGKSGVFALVLAFVLFGIAFGAKYANIIITQKKTNIPRLIALLLFAAGMLNFIGFPLSGHLMTFYEPLFQLSFLLVTVISFLLGSVFPLLCHIAIPTNKQSVGKYTSWIYAGTILGSTLGPLLTGFVLLDHFSDATIVTFLCIVCLTVAIAIYPKKSSNSVIISKFSLGALTAIVVMALTANTVYGNYFELFHFATKYDSDTKFAFKSHSKNGIITIVKNDTLGDVVYGGGVYDGKINIDIEKNSNGIHRAYMAAAIHPDPKKVLMIGLSTGSWAKILSMNDKIDSITVVEINPNYLKAIEKYPEIATILSDKKIDIKIDDGRRWLNRNPTEKFDLIVMNTTFYWREHSTNLLSNEFLLKCKNALNKDGILLWNTTGLKDSVYTGAHVFNHIICIDYSAVASDSPFTLSIQEKQENLLAFKMGGVSVFEKNENMKKILKELINIPLVDIKPSVVKEKLWLITDDNIAAEYKVDNLFSNFVYDKELKREPWANIKY